MSKRRRTSKFEHAVDTPPINDWALQIGKLMINYSALEAQIDRWVIHLSERAYTDANVTAERSRGFKQKHKEVTKLARGRSPSDEWLEKALDRLRRAKVIAGVRDQVAHAALYLLFDGLANSTPTARIPPSPRQRQAGSTSHLEYRGVQGAVDDAVLVVQDLGNLLEQWRNAYKAGNVQLDLSTLTLLQRVRRAGIYWWLRIRRT